MWPFKKEFQIKAGQQWKQVYTANPFVGSEIVEIVEIRDGYVKYCYLDNGAVTDRSMRWPFSDTEYRFKLRHEYHEN